MGVLFLPHNLAIEKRMRRDQSLLHCEELHLSSHKGKLPCVISSSSIARVWQVEGNDDILHEVLKFLDAKSLACASCVSRRWRKAADDQRLWEGICTRNWPSAASRPQQLKSVVLALGGFRRLYVLCLRPLLSRPYPPPHPLPFPSNPLLPCDRGSAGRQWSKDEVHLSLSLFSIDCYERLGRRSCSPSSLDFLYKASSSQMLEGLSCFSDLNNHASDR